MTATQRVIRRLIAAKGQWVDGLELAKVGGQYAWRTRVSDARKLGYSIENRMTRDGDKVVSEYRLLSALPVDMELLQTA